MPSQLPRRRRRLRPALQASLLCPRLINNRRATHSHSPSHSHSHGHDEEGWDAAQEMNATEEEGEFARFAAQVRGRDVESVRQEIDHEIRELDKQRKAAMRDSEDVTQAMVAQIMVSPPFSFPSPPLPSHLIFTSTLI